MRVKVVYYCEDCRRFILETAPEGYASERLRHLFDPPEPHKGHRLSRVP